jgi:hypothetical protein
MVAPARLVRREIVNKAHVKCLDLGAERANLASIGHRAIRLETSRNRAITSSVA